MGSEQQVQALRGISMRIKHNEYVAIMGPSGSGKSTLMNLIGCLDTPSKGNYWLNGQLVSELDDDQLARIRNKEIGFVFQTFNLLARASALHNVELPSSITEPRRRPPRPRQGVLADVGLESRMNHKPNELSGGQRQRVAIARALVNRPPSSSPTSPPETSTPNRLEIMALLDTLHANGNTIVVVTHEPTSRNSPIASSTSAMDRSSPTSLPNASASPACHPERPERINKLTVILSEAKDLLLLSPPPSASGKTP